MLATVGSESGRIFFFWEKIFCVVGCDGEALFFAWNLSHDEDFFARIFCGKRGGHAMVFWSSLGRVGGE